MRPNRIIVGEVRAEDCLDLLVPTRGSLACAPSTPTAPARYW